MTVMHAIRSYVNKYLQHLNSRMELGTMSIYKFAYMENVISIRACKFQNALYMYWACYISVPTRPYFCHLIFISVTYTFMLLNIIYCHQLYR